MEQHPLVGKNIKLVLKENVLAVLSSTGNNAAYVAQFSEDLPFWRTLATSSGSPILELGCGPGRVVFDLANEGFIVTGLDHDQEMIQWARSHTSGDLLEKIRERTNNDTDSIAILREIREDERRQQMQEKKVINGNLPATENQINYLKRLGMTEIPEDLNRDQASQMIDELKEKASYKKVLKAPIRIP